MIHKGRICPSEAPAIIIFYASPLQPLSGCRENPSPFASTREGLTRHETKSFPSSHIPLWIEFMPSTFLERKARITRIHLLTFSIQCRLVDKIEWKSIPTRNHVINLRSSGDEVNLNKERTVVKPPFIEKGNSVLIAMSLRIMGSLIKSNPFNRDIGLL